MVQLQPLGQVMSDHGFTKGAGQPVSEQRSQRFCGQFGQFRAVVTKAMTDKSINTAGARTQNMLDTLLFAL